MNIFEFLGLDANHRKPEKCAMRVKEYDEVTETKKKFPMMVQLKKDGVYAFVVKFGGRPAIFNRTGKPMTNVGTVDTGVTKDGVYLAELCNDKCSLEVLSGIVNPNRVHQLDDEQKALLPDMYLAYHDYLTLDEFIDGRCDASYEHRWNNVLEFVGFDGGNEVLDYIQVSTEERLQAIAAAAIERGEEGVVIKQYNEPWLAGHKGHKMMKKVRGIHVDLECIGYEEGTGKYKGKVANLLFRYKGGAVVKAMLGKGWKHEDAERLFNDHSLFMGKIFHVYGLQPSSKNGLIRLPKVGEERIDKTEADY